MTLIVSLLDVENKNDLKDIIVNLEQEGSTFETFYQGAFTKEIETYGGNTGLACLQLSLENIKDESLRNRYIMLGVYPIGVSFIPLESLKEIWNMDRLNDVKITAGLYKKRSLLERTDHGISLHELQRKFLVEVYQRYCREQREGFPVDNETIGYAFDSGGDTLERQGKYKEADDLFQELVAFYSKTLGKEHPDTLRATYRSALLLVRKGQYKKAEAMFQQVLSLQAKILGEEDPDTMATRVQLGWVASEQGRYKEAEDMYEKVLVIQKKSLGEEHPDTLNTRYSLAGVLVEQGRYKEAEDICLPLLVSMKQVLGEEHPHTLMAMGNLMFSVGMQGKYKESEELYEQVLVSFNKTFGKEHPTTLEVRQDFGLVLDKQGRYIEAEKILEEVKALRIKVLGEDHPDTVETIQKLNEIRKKIKQKECNIC